MFDIITIGSATIDVFVDTGKGLFRPCKRCPEHVNVPFGSKILVKSLNFFTGGGGTNTAVGFTRLGFKTAWIGKIGDDPTGNVVLEELRKEGVDASIAKVEKGCASGYSIILDAKGHDRTILTHKGCNDLLLPGDVDFKRINSRWIYSSSLLGRSLKTLKDIISKAKKKGIKIAFNPSTYMITNEKKTVRAILKNTDILVFNKEEAGLLVGDDDVGIMAKKVHGIGPLIVVITDGKDGAYASDGKTIWFCKAPQVHVVESTGAGDAFATGFVAGQMKGLSIPESMKVGMVESASIIQHFGAKNILMTWMQAKKQARHLTKGICVEWENRGP